MKWIGKRTERFATDFDTLKSLGVFSMIEGAILYSSFAFLKHFQTNGKNKLVNVNAGINYSAQDEDLHARGGAWLFRTYLAEYLKWRPKSDIFEDLQRELTDTAKIIFEHEAIIIQKIFEHGEIPGITAKQLENFVASRLDICLNNLGFPAPFKPTYNPIASWFYNNLNSSILHDFFVKQGSDYNRNWDERAFVW